MISLMISKETIKEIKRAERNKETEVIDKLLRDDIFMYPYALMHTCFDIENSPFAKHQGAKNIKWITYPHKDYAIVQQVKNRKGFIVTLKHDPHLLICKHVYAEYFFKPPTTYQKLKNGKKVYFTEQEYEQRKVNSYNKKATWAAFQRENSEVLILDIDNHDKKSSDYILSICKKITNRLGEENLLAAEKGRSGGFHLYFKLDKKYNKETRKTFVESIRKELDIPTYRLEFNCAALRFFGSYEYTILNPENLYDFEILDILTASKLFCDRFSIIKGIAIENIVEKNIVEQAEVPKKKSKKPSAIYARTVSTLSEQSILNNEELNIYEGERHQKTFKIVRSCKRAGLTADETWQVIRQKNVSSKDLSDYNKLEYLRKGCINLYDKCEAKPISIQTTSPDDYISNAHRVPEKIQKRLLNQHTLSQLCKRLEIKVSERNRDIIKIVLSEMLGKMYFNIENPRTIIDSEHSEKHLIGLQFSEHEAGLLRKQHEILQTVDVFAYVNRIFKKSGLFTQYKTNNLGYGYFPYSPEYNFCRQFDLSSNDSHIIFNSFDTLTYHILNSYLLPTSSIITFSEVVEFKKILSNKSLKNPYNLLYPIFSENNMQEKEILYESG